MPTTSVVLEAQVVPLVALVATGQCKAATQAMLQAQAEEDPGVNTKIQSLCLHILTKAATVLLAGSSSPILSPERPLAVLGVGRVTNGRTSNVRLLAQRS